MKYSITALIVAVSIVAAGCAQQSDVSDLEQRIEQLESDLKTATAEIAKVESAADQAAEDLLEALRLVVVASGDVGRDLDNTKGELIETRLWVGDLAACMIYEADGGRYDYWEATRSGGFLDNRGEWDRSSFNQVQMSHCER